MLLEHSGKNDLLFSCDKYVCVCLSFYVFFSISLAAFSIGYVLALFICTRLISFHFSLSRVLCLFCLSSCRFPQSIFRRCVVFAAMFCSPSPFPSRYSALRSCTIARRLLFPGSRPITNGTPHTFAALSARIYHASILMNVNFVLTNFHIHLIWNVAVCERIAAKRPIRALHEMRPVRSQHPISP